MNKSRYLYIYIQFVKFRLLPPIYSNGEKSKYSSNTELFNKFIFLINNKFLLENVVNKSINKKCVFKYHYNSNDENIENLKLIEISYVVKKLNSDDYNIIKHNILTIDSTFGKREKILKYKSNKTEIYEINQKTELKNIKKTIKHSKINNKKNLLELMNTLKDMKK